MLHHHITPSFLLAALLAASMPLVALAQDTAKVEILYRDGQRQEETLTNPSQIEPLMQAFLRENRDGVLSITSRMESGRDEMIFWAKKSAGRVSFTPDESQWVTVEEALGRFRGANAFTHLSACQRHLETLGEALDRWAGEHQGHPPQRLEELVPKYLGVLPTCPTAPTVSYASTYKLSTAKRYTFYCPGNHEEAGITLTFPAYDGIRGVTLP